MPNNQANSGSDLIPVQYNVTGVATTYFWPEPQRLKMPFYLSHPVVTPTWGTVAVVGPSQLYARQCAAGTVACRITQANIPTTGAPYFATVILEGVSWQIQGGAIVAIPQAIIDVLNSTSTFHVTTI